MSRSCGNRRSRPDRHADVLAITLLLAALGATELAAADFGSAHAGGGSWQPVPCELVHQRTSHPGERARELALVVEAVHAGRAEPDRERRKCRFQAAEALARRLVFEDPRDPEARYWYAAALGLRANEEGGRTQVQLAQRAHEQARLTLTVAPDHAGAQHVLGRLHAAVMRLSSLKRFIATRLLGGDALSGASWESAEAFLSTAARLAPEVPEHHYQLAMLYVDTGRPALAIKALEAVLSCSGSLEADQAVQASARTIVRRLRAEATG